MCADYSIDIPPQTHISYLDCLKETLVTHREAGRGGPDAVSFGVEDGGLVYIAGADEADRDVRDAEPLQ